MLYSNMIKMAMEVAYEAHSGRVDRAGYPYIAHPLHVAEKMKTENEVIVALLHDVVEDTNIDLTDLVHFGFSEEVVEAVDAITRRYEESYEDYIQRVKRNPIARNVKIEDMKHNSDFTRIEGETWKDAEDRYMRYDKALRQLLGD